MKSSLWVEKYRPKTLSEMILSNDCREYFLEMIKNRSIPNLLFVGPVGTGKTSVARILIAKLDCASLVLNASDERGIDTIREKVKSFVKTKTFKPWKIVFMDEADALTREAQDSLRSLMETHSEYARFLFTANYENKISDAIQSRCQVVKFEAVPKGKVLELLLRILREEEVENDPAMVMDLLDDTYPDIRRAINQLQLYSMYSTCSTGKNFEYKRELQIEERIIEGILDKNIKRVRQVVASYPFSFLHLYRILFDAADAGRFGETNSDKAMILIAEYMYRDSLVADREMNFAAMCLGIMRA